MVLCGEAGLTAGNTKLLNGGCQVVLIGLYYCPKQDDINNVSHKKLLKDITVGSK